MFATLPRRQDVSVQVFHDHWRHPHGTFGRRISTVRRYVQSHRIDTELLGEEQPMYDGIVEVWFDNVSDALTLGEHPTYRRYLVPDEPRFIDMDGLRYVFTNERIVASGQDPAAVRDEADLDWAPEVRPTSIKLIQFETDASGAGGDEQEIADLAGRLGALRHARCVPAVEIHPEGADFTGVRELWWPTLTALENAVTADREAWRRLLAPPHLVSVVAQAERFL